MRAAAPICAIALALPLSGCGLSKSSPRPAVVPYPDATPLPDWNSPVVPGVYAWRSLTVADSTPLSGLGSCATPRSLTIHYDGSYVAGPCKAGGAQSAGNIAPSDLDSINQLVQAQIATGLSQQVVRCDLPNAPPGAILELTLSSGASYPIYDTSLFPNACYLGDRATDVNLLEAVQKLEPALVQNS